MEQVIDPLEAYRKPYKMRALGKNGLNTVVSIPPEVLDREARRRGLSVEQFKAEFHAIAQFDNFDGVFYTFERRNGDEEKG